ncbi:MAG: hypothetical protein ABGZ17_25075 [Planctomycetaceae bacterium]
MNFGSWLSWMGWLIGLLRGDLQSRIGDVVVVQMPQCEICSQHGSPEPVHVNSHELRMTFIVNKDFKNGVLNDVSR